MNQKQKQLYYQLNFKKVLNYERNKCIVCSFNHEKWIERCLRSLINQKIIKQDDYEILIVNDKSEDNTKKILKKYNNISNLKIINNSKNIGLPSSINKAIHKSSGRYIVRVDSDDYVDRYFYFCLLFSK